jgi:hypothetical protein
MKILRIILNLIACLIGLLLAINLPVNEEIKNILFHGLMFYGLLALSFSVLREIILVSFPRKIGLLIVFAFIAFQIITNNFIVAEKEYSKLFVVYAASILSFSILIHSFLGDSFSFNHRKIDVRSFRSFYRRNNWFFIVLFVVLVSLVFLLERDSKSNYLIRISAILLAIFPFLNKDFIRGLTQRLKSSKDFSALGIGLEYLGKLGWLKNFVFTKDKIISTGIYQVTESDYRSSVRVTTALQIARILANEWNPRYAKLFVMDEFEKLELNFRLVEKNENGISVIDDDACMYHLGNATFVKDKIRVEDKFNLFLIKNDLQIAKFRINEKIATEKTELINQLDYFGQTQFIYNGNIHDLGHDYTIIFDKIYPDISEQKQTKLLKDLDKKMPTAFFSSKAPKEVVNSVYFYITSNIDLENTGNMIVLDSQMLLKVPVMIKLAKKVHSLFRYTLLSSIGFQLIMGIIALFNYNSFILIFSLNIGIGILTEIIALIITRKIAQLPTKPPNFD